MSERDLSMDCHDQRNYAFDIVEVDHDDAISPNVYDGTTQGPLSPSVLTQQQPQRSSCPSHDSSASKENNIRDPQIAEDVSVNSISTSEMISPRNGFMSSNDRGEDDVEGVPPFQLSQATTSVPYTPSTAPHLNDSLDASDVAFSQELMELSDGSDVSASETASLSDFESKITNEEIFDLCPAQYLASSANNIRDSGSALCEDIYSRLYHDYDEERFNPGHWDDIEYEDSSSPNYAPSTEELEARKLLQRNGGLENWDYDSPFADVSVRIDDVNQVLAPRFLTEANTALDRVTNDIASRAKEDVNAEMLRALHARKKRPTTKNELLGMVILHTLCAAYNESPSTVCNVEESDYFFQMGVSSDRYHEVWGSLSGSRERRATHEYSSAGWSRSANRSTTLITDIESEIAAINRELLYVPSATILSLDDDHLRMASRALVELTYLQQYNNPKKGLGPVGNALCSALNPFFIACHFTRTGEKLMHTWERLVQLVQGATTNGALRPMPEAIFAADRGYNSKETIQFLSKVLGASLIGTHNRDLWYPFVFGDGPISRRQKGMNVSEKGARAVYTARFKGCGPRSHSSQVRRAEACLYRESCSSRIAALIHNNSNMFPSRSFTVVCREAFRPASAMQKIEGVLPVYDGCKDPNDRATRTAEGISVLHSAVKCVDQVLAHVTVLTYYQSQDPVWFLLRAFRFTSRTGHGFLAAVAKDFENRMNGLAWLLREKTLSPGTESLDKEAVLVNAEIRHKWEHVLGALGLNMRTLPRPSSRRTVSERLATLSESRLNATTKSELQNMLAAFDRGLDTRVPKQQLIDAANQLKEDISNSLVDLDANAVDLGSTADERAEAASKDLQKAFREASLNAWVMKPLVATAGMREGSRNELELLNALPSYFDTRKGAYRRRLASSIYEWDKTFAFDIKHIRCAGLVESKKCTMLADSPDAVLVASDDDDIDRACAVEIKTMTSVTTIEAATLLSQKYGPVISIQNVGTEDKSTELFKELVPNAQYRAQVLHHAAALGVNVVLFVVGTGGSVTQGRILYTCIIEFAQYLCHGYTYTMDYVRVSSFRWVGAEAKHIPPDYDESLRGSHASDLYTFVSYYNLSRALRKEVIDRGRPIPLCRMIRLTPVVYWNNLKGGVDVTSRYLKTLARSNMSENPVVSIIARLLSMQTNNAAIIYRLHKARKANLLPRTIVEDENGSKGHAALSHKVTQSVTFGGFARLLAKQWVDEQELDRSSRQIATDTGHLKKLTPTFTRNAADKFNRGAFKSRRLNTDLAHKKVTAQPTYCALCSWTLRGVKDGKPKVRRKGSRQVQWCLTCKQAICTACWSSWHRDEVLKRNKPSSRDVEAFEQSLRSKRRRRT